MAEIQHSVQRQDVDIQEDVQRLIFQYPPLVKDRHHIDIRVEGGVVFLNGNISTPINRRYLETRIPQIEGVWGIDLGGLYDDETIRLECGRMLPPGVKVARVEYGTVILTGRLPEGIDAAELAEQVDAIPGVWQVVTQFD